MCHGDDKIIYIDAICPLLISVRKMPVDFAFSLDNDGKPDSRDAVIILQVSPWQEGG